MKRIILLLCLFTYGLSAQNWAPFPLNQITTWVDDEDYVDYFFADSTYTNIQGDSILLLNTTFYDERLVNCMDSIIAKTELDESYFSLVDTILITPSSFIFKKTGNEFLLKPFQPANESYFTHFIYNGDSLFLTSSFTEYFENELLADSVKYFYPTYKSENTDSTSEIPLFVLGKNVGFIQMVNPFYLMQGTYQNNLIHGYQKQGDYQRGFVGSTFDFSFQPQCFGDKITKRLGNTISGDFVSYIFKTDTSLTYHAHYSSHGNPFNTFFSVKHYSLFNRPLLNNLARNKKLFSISNGNDYIVDYEFDYTYNTLKVDSLNRVKKSTLDQYWSMSDDCVNVGNFISFNPIPNYDPLFLVETLGQFNSWFNNPTSEANNYIKHGIIGYKICDDFWGDSSAYDVSVTPIHLLQNQLHPNPTTHFLNIRLPNDIFKAQIQIFNAEGKQIMQQAYKQKLDVSSLNNGIYLINIQTDSKTYYGRFVKMK